VSGPQSGRRRLSRRRSIFRHRRRGWRLRRSCEGVRRVVEGVMRRSTSLCLCCPIWLLLLLHRLGILMSLMRIRLSFVLHRLLIHHHLSSSPSGLVDSHRSVHLVAIRAWPFLRQGLHLAASICCCVRIVGGIVMRRLMRLRALLLISVRSS